MSSHHGGEPHVGPISPHRQGAKNRSWAWVYPCAKKRSWAFSAAYVGNAPVVSHHFHGGEETLHLDFATCLRERPPHGPHRENRRAATMTRIASPILFTQPIPGSLGVRRTGGIGCWKVPLLPFP